MIGDRDHFFSELNDRRSKFLSIIYWFFLKSQICVFMDKIDKIIHKAMMIRFVYQFFFTPLMNQGYTMPTQCLLFQIKDINNPNFMQLVKFLWLLIWIHYCCLRSRKFN